MRKLITLTLLISLANFSVIAQNVNIPDANFKAYLVGNTSINTNADSEIQVSEANSFTGSIICNNLNISDLTGIEAFTSIIALTCSQNNLTTLDLSSNTSLVQVSCDFNSLTTLDVSQCSNLNNLYCGYNNLTSLDISNNPSLYSLSCGGNDLTALNTSANTNLNILECGNNANLGSIDLTNNTNLTILQCVFNNLNSLDLTNNVNLTTVECNFNNIDSLDLSQNTSLSFFSCMTNNLTYLNMHNLSTSTLTQFNATSNPLLECILVDDVAAATSSWTNIDATASFSLDCITLVNSITVQGQGGVSTITTDGGTLQMEATILPSNASDQTITWSVTNGTGSATIDANGILTAQTNGIVTVVATANDGSGINGSADITLSNQIGVGVNEISEQNLMIYPNPTRTSFTIKTQAVIQNIYIVDVVGKSYSIPVNSEKVVDLTNFKSGVYFVVIETPNGNITKRITKL